MEKLYRLGLREAAQRIREGALTAEALTGAGLTRGSRLEPRIEAWQHLAPGRALERAEHLDAARSAGSPLGPLHGIALGIKDIIDVAGMPTTMGSPIHAGRMASTSAPMVEGLEAAGGVLFRKTGTTAVAGSTPQQTKKPPETAPPPGGAAQWQ